MDLNKLKDKFNENQIEWRIQRKGMYQNKPWAMVLCYVDARAVQDRLDAVCGPEGWATDFTVEGEKGVLCRLSIKVNEEWISRVDGSPFTDYEPFKGGISKALVRAAAQWGIGRYLYDLPESFATTSLDKMDDWFKDKHEQTYFWWKPPALPKWALPDVKLSEADVKEIESTEEKKRIIIEQIKNRMAQEVQGLDDIAKAEKLRDYYNMWGVKTWTELSTKDVLALNSCLFIVNTHKTKDDSDGAGAR
jgi:hypothetical protein